jgi:hypothetical protein
VQQTVVAVVVVDKVAVVDSNVVAPVDATETVAVVGTAVVVETVVYAVCVCFHNGLCSSWTYLGKKRVGNTRALVDTEKMLVVVGPVVHVQQHWLPD